MNAGGFSATAAGGVELEYNWETGQWSFAPIGFGDVGDNAAGAGAWVTPSEFGPYFYFTLYHSDNLEIHCGAGLEIDYGRFNNFFNSQYWAGTLPVDE